MPGGACHVLSPTETRSVARLVGGGTGPNFFDSEAGEDAEGGASREASLLAPEDEALVLLECRERVRALEAEFQALIGEAREPRVETRSKGVPRVKMRLWVL